MEDSELQLLSQIKNRISLILVCTKDKGKSNIKRWLSNVSFLLKYKMIRGKSGLRTA